MSDPMSEFKKQLDEAVKLMKESGYLEEVLGGSDDGRYIFICPACGKKSKPINPPFDLALVMLPIQKWFTVINADNGVMKFYCSKECTKHAGGKFRYEL